MDLTDILSGVKALKCIGRPLSMIRLLSERAAGVGQPGARDHQEN